MKLIDRYLLREYLGATAYCLVAFSLLHVIIDLFERLPQFVSSGMPWIQVVAFYGNFLMAFNGPTAFFALILPISMLLGLLYALYGFSRHNELTAMRACGISLYRLMQSFIFVSIFAVGLCLFIQEQIAPGASLRVAAVERVLRGAQTGTPPLTQLPFFNQPARRRWMIGSMDPLKPHILHDVQITTERDDHSRAMELTAERAEWRDGSWWFFEAGIRRFDADERPLGPLSKPSPIPIEKRELTETPTDILLSMRGWELFSTMEMRDFIDTHPGLSTSDQARRRVDMHIRLAMPWVCLIVTFLGIPGGVHSHRQGALSGILTAIFFLFVFYTLLQAGSYLAKRMLVPPWAGAWFPNIVFFIMGVYMIRRMK